MPLSPVDIVNRAIFSIGDDQPPVTGTYPNFDDSPAGVAASILYDQVVQTVARQFGFDFSRNTAALVATDNPPPVQWDFEYAYPANGIEVRQLVPPEITDTNDPRPVRWTVGNVLVDAVPTKVIWSDLADALATFTNQPPPALWDAGFTETVVDLLGSKLAMALAGQPETSKGMLEISQGFGQMAEGRDG